MIIEVEGLLKHYDKVTAVDNVSFGVKRTRDVMIRKATLNNMLWPSATLTLTAIVLLHCRSPSIQKMVEK
jgi:ABC-type branched-subunit amino acid transport system ATPase component